MNSADIHLKFESSDQAKSLLISTGILKETRTLLGIPCHIVSQSYLLDEIGLIYEPTGTMLVSEEGVEYPEMTPIKGWHINMRGDLPEELQQYVIVVNTPHRIWD
jgi:hypothetical protein